MRRAFSLVELLVVIVILAIIAAILFPVFARAKENAKQSNCLSNLRQDSLGMRLYRADNDDLGYRHVMGLNRYPWNWYDGLAPYIKDGRLVWCSEPGDWDRPGIDYGLYKWHHYSIGQLGIHSEWISWDSAPGRVVFYCTNHNRGDQPNPYSLRSGMVLFSREDGSAGKVDNSQIEQWEYSDTTKEWKKYPFPSGWNATQSYAKFPREPWPPIPEI